MNNKKDNTKNNKPDSIITGDKKVIIGGTGRAGTTFLILLLTRLGFYTGFKPYEEPMDEGWRAGAEFPFIQKLDSFNTKKERRHFFMEEVPFIIKTPWFSFTLGQFMEEGIIDVGCVIVPVRDVEEATRSRLSVNLSWFNSEADPNFDGSHIPFEHEKNMGFMALGNMIESCVLYDIPMSFLKFPDFLNDYDYCYRSLDSILGLETAGISKELFNEKMEELNKGGSLKTKISGNTTNKKSI